MYSEAIKIIFKHQEFLHHLKIAKSHKLSLKLTIEIKNFHLKMWIPENYFHIHSFK